MRTRVSSSAALSLRQVCEHCNSPSLLVELLAHCDHILSKHHLSLGALAQPPVEIGQLRRRGIELSGELVPLGLHAHQRPIHPSGAGGPSPASPPFHNSTSVGARTLCCAMSPSRRQPACVRAPVYPGWSPNCWHQNGRMGSGVMAWSHAALGKWGGVGFGGRLRGRSDATLGDGRLGVGGQSWAGTQLLAPVAPRREEVYDEGVVLVVHGLEVVHGEVERDLSARPRHV